MSRKAMKSRSIESSYDYRDESGELLFQVVRLTPKGFRQRRPDGKGGWIQNLNGTRRVLYRLPELLKASMQDYVFVVEGEKDCDRLWAEGIAATTSPMGAGNWRDDYAMSLKGRLVAIIPDNDAPGRKYAEKVATSLHGVAGDTRIVQLPGLEEHGDVSDWLDKGGPIPQLMKLVEQSPLYAPAADLSSEGQDHPYLETDGGLFRISRTRNGGTEKIPLTNFTARIIADCAYDDGVEQRTMFEIEARIEGRSQRFSISGSEFNAMAWPTNYLGARAIVYPGTTRREHARVAIQVLSEDVVRQTRYAHTGWRQMDGQWAYLHGDGALGPQGPVLHLKTSLPDSLAHYRLPNPSESEDLRDAVRASLGIVDLVPETIGWPLYCLPWCAILDVGRFTCHLVGNTGAGKSEVAALIQRHFGPQMDGTHLPGSWSSTSNALQGLAFAAKDTLLTIDDFAPSGSQSDVLGLHRKASDIIRSQANRSARQRMRADATLRPSKPPRGLILSTGEDVPKGQSIQARMIVLELGQDDMHWEKLTDCQKHAASGVYTLVTSAFICWLAQRYDEVRRQIPDMLADLRAKAARATVHRRTPTAIAEMAMGLHFFLEFAHHAGAITRDEREGLWKRAWNALLQVAANQSAQQVATDPALRFLELVASAIGAGSAHVAGPGGGTPESPDAWGWREKRTGLDREYLPQGFCIGWVDGESLYLDPTASYKIAQSMAGNGDGIVVSERTLRKRLNERGVLIADETRGTLTVRRMLAGAQRKVLYLFRHRIMGFMPEETAIPDILASDTDSYIENRNTVSGSLSDSRPDTFTTLTSAPDTWGL